MTLSFTARRTLPTLGILVALLWLMISLATHAAGAAALVVNGDSPLVTNDGVCTLPEAILNANADDQSGSSDCLAGSGADTITFATDYTITLSGSQLPTITSEMTITGNGAANTIIEGSTTPARYRIFEVGPAGNLTLERVTVRYGNSCVFAGCTPDDYAGGGIANYGTLTVTSSTLSDNSASAHGGAIANYGTMTVTNSTLSDNRSSSGAGISNRGTLTVIASTLSGNSAENSGGGIDNFEGTVTVINSTLSGNTAIGYFGGSGGGISNDAAMNIINSTLAGNDAQFGGGIYNSGTAAVLVNSLVSGNTAAPGDEIYQSQEATMTAEGNILGQSDITNADGFFNFEPDASNLVATSDGENIPLSNILETTLSDNGGPTLTLALVPGSPAIDFIASAACAAPPVNGVDQRGEPRNVDGNGVPGANECDAGAFEQYLAREYLPFITP